ncbi:MAG: hypothetical protein ONB30_12355 [candidate division KSB1 bacterium]|nr:hypothetical protein [candidate division KSB1 bacterium]
MRRHASLAYVALLLSFWVGIEVGWQAGAQADVPGGKHCIGLCIRWDASAITWECTDFQAPDCVHCSQPTCEPQ